MSVTHILLLVSQTVHIMYEYTAILYIILLKILVANTDEDYDSGVWLSASKDLENESDDLRDALCELTTLMGEKCNADIIQDMRTFFINTENVRKSAKLYDLFALNFLNKGLVGCLKDVVKVVASISISTTMDSVKCVFQPLIDLVKLALRMTLDSVKVLRHVHHETKECLTKRPIPKAKCLIALHGKAIKASVKSLVDLLRSVAKATTYISGGFALTLYKCSTKGSSSGFLQMTKTAAKFGKCIYCAFTRRCGDSN